MKAIHIFDLLNEESKYEYNLRNKAHDMYSIIYGFTSLIRHKIKYGEDRPSKDLKKMVDNWYELLQENNFDPYEDL